MTFRGEVVCLHDGGEQRCRVVEMERAELALETLGMIGIGAAVTRRPLPHHRAYGSVHGGSSRLR